MDNADQQSQAAAGSSGVIVVAQVLVRPGAPEENARACVTAIEQAAAQRAGLVVFTECVLTGYVFDTRSEVFRAALDPDGVEVELIKQACAKHDMHAVVGLLERQGGMVYNSALLLGPGGALSVYRKQHLPIYAADRFVMPGGQPEVPVVDTPLGRVGIAICFDLRFPERFRALALQGADIVAVPTNWPMEAAIVPELFTRTRAAENRIYLAVANRGDEERGTKFLGRSQIVDPSGTVLAEAGRGVQALSATVDLAHTRQKTFTMSDGVSTVPLFDGRRPELYADLVTAAGRRPW
jgi:predicted amidohydrolase